MYTTKTFNPHKVPGYVSLGDPYEKAKPKDERYKGKQFTTSPPKQGQTAGYFGKYEYKPDAYQDTNAYRVLQPREQRKKGFGSGDASKRDEFTLDLRAQQYKEHLASELSFSKKFTEENAQRLSSSSSSLSSSLPASLQQTALSFSQRLEEDQNRERDKNLFQNTVPSLLFDLEPTPVCNKCSRERFYCKHRVEAAGIRRKGGLKCTSEEFGPSSFDSLNSLNKPQFGIKSSIKHEFFDSGHVGVKTNTLKPL